MSLLLSLAQILSAGVGSTSFPSQREFTHFFQFPRKDLTACKMVTNNNIWRQRRRKPKTTFDSSWSGNSSCNRYSKLHASEGLGTIWKAISKTLKSAKCIASLRIKNTVLCNTSYYKVIQAAQMEKDKIPAWTQCLQLQPCTTGFHSNQSEMMLPCMRLIPPVERSKQTERYDYQLLFMEKIYSTQESFTVMDMFEFKSFCCIPWLHLPHQKQPFS